MSQFRNFHALTRQSVLTTVHGMMEKGMLAAAALVLAGSAALAEDIPDKSYDWAGFYAGVQAGYAFGKGSIVNDFFADGTDIFTSSEDLNGLNGGIFVGFNVESVPGLVWGLEGDLNIGDQSDYGNATLENGGLYTGTLDYIDTNFFGSGRARFGLVSDRLLSYVAAGVAVADLQTGYTPGTTVGSNGSGSGIALGYTVGAGVEVAASDKVRLRAEYRYTNYGTTKINVNTTNVNAPVTPYEVAFSTSNVVVGVSVGF